MLCDKCKKNTASLFMNNIVNNVKYTTHLCQDCAEANFAISIQNFMLGLISNFDFDNLLKAESVGEQLVCENCKMTSTEFAQSGRFGCAKCYKHFHPQILPLLKQLNGSHMHFGKIPKKTDPGAIFTRQVQTLSKDLELAILEENYEAAAKIRDELRALEKENVAEKK